MIPAYIQSKTKGHQIPFSLIPEIKHMEGPSCVIFWYAFFYSVENSAISPN